MNRKIVVKTNQEGTIEQIINYGLPIERFERYKKQLQQKGIKVGKKLPESEKS